MCPPGVDQTTRTPERWNLLAPALKERYNITDDLIHETKRRPEIENVLRNDYTWGAFEKLASYIRDGETALSWVPLHSTAAQDDSFGSLPPEIVRLILSQPKLDAIDVLSLGMTSYLLWTHVVQYIASSAKKAPWANSPLVCTGTSSPLAARPYVYLCRIYANPNLH